jgi:hypothetical protein
MTVQSKSRTRENKLAVQDLRFSQLIMNDTQITTTPAELNTLSNGLADASFAVGTQAGDDIIVSIQLKDADGTDLATRASCMAYLSDDANGDSVAATAASGNVVISTDGLAIPLVAKKCWLLTSEADGDIAISITEAGADTWYLVLVMPNGSLRVSGAITFA